MLGLHYAPDNASLIIRIVLEELELPYETRLVDRRISAQTSPAYKAVNPRGKIPALETPDGPIFETAAILLYLTELSGTMAPPPGAAGRGAFLSWLFALSNGLQTDLHQMFHTERYAGADPDAIAGHRARTAGRIREMLDLLEGLAGSGQDWFCGPALTVLDIYVAVALRWPALYPAGGTDWFRLADWPALRALAARVETRPSMIRAEHFEGLGPTPLTAPRHPRPPEGSAL